MILPAPTSLAAWIVLSPTPPQPHTATLAPGGTLARLNTGPAPASTPQETRHTTSSGASLRMGMTPRSTWCASSRSEEHTSELQSHSDIVCRRLLEKKKHHNAIQS